jgi:hypothetical protein
MGETNAVAVKMTQDERYRAMQERIADDVLLFLEAASGNNTAHAMRHGYGWRCEIGNVAVFFAAGIDSDVVIVDAHNVFSTRAGSGIRRTFTLHDPVTRQEAAKQIGRYVAKHNKRELLERLARLAEEDRRYAAMATYRDAFAKLGLPVVPTVTGYNTSAVRLDNDRVVQITNTGGATLVPSRLTCQLQLPDLPIADAAAVIALLVQRLKP